MNASVKFANVNKPKQKFLVGITVNPLTDQSQLVHHDMNIDQIATELFLSEIFIWPTSHNSLKNIHQFVRICILQLTLTKLLRRSHQINYFFFTIVGRRNSKSHAVKCPTFALSTAQPHEKWEKIQMKKFEFCSAKQ